eukprot:TRINITY_DN18276_c0_g4_i1.p1 TRINITY_DN18276_c0_g4~~TRINITY_DN18276_c0_g4_i1.p1  ORF type:complete len:805 (+),score=143.44 TRINITY_DN18276_c0_g4_i1:54-2417(+)
MADSYAPLELSEASCCTSRPLLATNVNELKEDLALPGDPSDDIVQFTAPIYYVEADEGTLVIDVMRLGYMHGHGAVRYRTVNASATAGVHYQATSGVVVFGPKEFNKEIRIKTIERDVWAATLEFKVVLESPQNCELGRYLHTCRVKVIDNHMFPSTKYKEWLVQEDVRGIDMHGLFWEYCKLNFREAGVAGYARLRMIFDQMQNFYLLLTIYAHMYLVNVVFKMHDESTEEDLFMLPLDPPRRATRAESAYIIGAALVIPMAILHLWEYYKAKCDIEGRSLLYLQKTLFRKYLNYSAESRIVVDSSKLQYGIDNDAEKLSLGYNTFLDLLSIFGKIAIQVLFIIQKNPGALWCLVASSTVAIIWSVTREAMTFKMRGAASGKAALSAFLHDICVNYELIADYFQRPRMNELFTEKASAAREMKMPKLLFHLNTVFLLKTLHPLFIFFYICFEATNVVNGVTSLGAFLGTVAVITNACKDAAEGYSHYKVVSESFKPLSRITMLLNKAIDTRDAKKVNRERRSSTLAHRSSQLQELATEDIKFKTDRLPIYCKGLSYSYKMGGRVLSDVNVSVAQGSCVAITGPKQSGKSCFMRLLANKYCPEEGVVFIPTHLRILHVSADPLILGNSLYANLTLGLSDSRDVDAQRIEGIMSALEMTRSVALLRDSNTSPRAVEWQQRLPSSEIHMIHIARAFIMNPEVLVMQMPFAIFNAQGCSVLGKACTSHVRDRGLNMPAEQRESRRPRTLFYSAYREEVMQYADTVWLMKPAADESGAWTVDQTTGERQAI